MSPPRRQPPEYRRRSYLEAPERSPRRPRTLERGLTDPRPEARTASGGRAARTRCPAGVRVVPGTQALAEARPLGPHGGGGGEVRDLAGARRDPMPGPTARPRGRRCDRRLAETARRPDPVSRDVRRGAARAAYPARDPAGVMGTLSRGEARAAHAPSNAFSREPTGGAAQATGGSAAKALRQPCCTSAPGSPSLGTCDREQRLPQAETRESESSAQPAQVTSLQRKRERPSGLGCRGVSLVGRKAEWCGGG